MQRQRRRRSKCKIRPVRLLLEQLEYRSLMSGSPWPLGFQTLPAAGNNVTLDMAQNLQAVNPSGQVGALGSIGNGPASAADVYYYSFTVPEAERVHLQTYDQPQGPHLDAVLSLYNTDPENPLGQNLLVQEDGAANGGYAVIDQTLGVGTYYVAVSGSGNDYFEPFMVNSGYAGSTGAYALLISAAAVNVQPTDGPAVLSAGADSVDGALMAGVQLPGNPPLPGAPTPGVPVNPPQLTASPYLLRVEMSAPIDPNSIVPDGNVILNYSPTSDFTNPAAMQLYGTQVNFDSTPGQVQELQVTPPAPLGPGYYQLLIQGNSNVNPQPILSLDDSTYLGQNNANPSGQDYSFTFQVIGSEGIPGTNPSADDTPATARVLGSIAGAGRIQVPGVLGDDPTDPNGFNPSAVNMYQFEISGSGTYAFAAEAFAGRIGSTLSPALTLFQLNPLDGQLELVASNGGTANATLDTHGNAPLLNDPALFVGLTPGVYYLAVSSGLNFPGAGRLPGVDGVFNPNISQSGMLGNSTGPYVLNVEVEPSLYSPHVVATSVTAGQVLTAPPTTLIVQFDRPVDVQQMAFDSKLGNGSSDVPAVFFVDGSGNQIHPLLQSYDSTTNQATFLLPSALPNGDYTLHLSGADGLTDFAGDPLVGNSPSGDYVVPFSIDAPVRGTPGNSTAWLSQQAPDSLAAPQVLGLLFPQELLSTVTITQASALPTDTGDYYQFTLLTSAEYYYFHVNSFTGAAPVLALYANGKPEFLSVARDGSYTIVLQPGSYVLGVTWAAGVTTPEAYQVAIFAPQQHESATPLTIGPAPALRLQLVSDAPPPTSLAVLPPPPPPVLPPPTELPPANPAAVPVDNTPIVAAAPIQATASPPVDIPGVSVYSVSINTPAPTSAIATGPAGGQGTVAAAANRSSTTPSLPPYLVQALSQGPLGGVSGLEPNNAAPVSNFAQAGQSNSPPGAGFGPSSKGSLLADEPGPVEDGPTVQAVSASAESTSGEITPLPLPAVVQGLASLDSALQMLDSWWQSQRLTAPPPSPTQAQPSISAQEIVALGPPLAEVVEGPAAVLPESVPSRLLKWVAIAGLGVTWGVINARKTWVARRPPVCALERHVSS